MSQPTTQPSRRPQTAPQRSNPTRTAIQPSTAAPRSTRLLLACGAVAGPVYVAVAAAQVLTRDGFDLRQHAVSLLSNGDLGWIQISNFVVTGLLTIAGAVGLRRALHNGRGGAWAPRLVAIYGASLIGAGVFVADPMNGFPAGAPELPAGSVSGHGLAHLAVGSVGFVALIAASVILARRFASEGRRGWAVASLCTGIGFLVAFAGIASGSGAPALNLAFTAAVVAVAIWLTALHLMLRRALREDT